MLTWFKDLFAVLVQLLTDTCHGVEIRCDDRWAEAVGAFNSIVLSLCHNASPSFLPHSTYSLSPFLSALDMFSVISVNTLRDNRTGTMPFHVTRRLFLTLTDAVRRRVHLLKCTRDKIVTRTCRLRICVLFTHATFCL